MDRRVVVTGVGMISPLGIGVQASWSALCAGKSGVAPITRFDATPYDTHIAAEVKGYHPEEFMGRKEARRLELFISYAVAATRMAIDDSGLKITAENAGRIGVITGCGLGGLRFMEDTIYDLKQNGPRRVSPFFIPMMIGNMAPGMISILFGAKGPNLSLATACAAGAHAVGDSFKLIQQGRVDAMITGGTEAVIAPSCIAGFNAMKALSTRNAEPERASRPFERDRDGFVPGEGAGILILEELDHARQRGARIYAEVAGYGLTGDGYHMTSPPPDGNGAARCMQMAIEDAGIRPEQVDYINAHGTSTPTGDSIEVDCLRAIFGRALPGIPVSANKSQIGHTLGGAAAIEASFAIEGMRRGIILPTVNHIPDPEMDGIDATHAIRTGSTRPPPTPSPAFWRWDGRPR